MKSYPPWQHLHHPSDPEASLIFHVSTICHVGDGHSCRFWTDQCSNGRSASAIAPLVYDLVPYRRRKLGLLHEGLHLRSITLIQYVDLLRQVRLIHLSETLTNSNGGGQNWESTRPNPATTSYSSAPSSTPTGAGHGNLGSAQDQSSSLAGSPGPVPDR